MEIVTSGNKLHGEETPFGKSPRCLPEIPFKIGVVPVQIIRQKGIGGDSPRRDDSLPDRLYRQESGRFLRYKSGTSRFQETAPDFVLYSGYIMKGCLQHFTAKKRFQGQFYLSLVLL